MAFLTISSVGVTLFVQYRAVSTEVERLEQSSQIISEVRHTSLLIHALQKERGLSASFLVNMDAVSVETIQQQRRLTDSIINQSKAPILTADWLTAFHNGLPTIRERVDSDITSWNAARSFYTDAITSALDTITIKILDGEQVGSNRVMMAVVSLAHSREHLGLIRAGISRIYRQNTYMNDDIQDVTRHYGAYTEHQRAFSRDLTGHNRDLFMSQVYTDAHETVTHRIESVLGFLKGHRDHHTANTWWDEVTLVIDTMKTVEDNIYGDLSRQISHQIEGKQAQLIKYSLVALFLAAIIAVLTVLTVIRILKAMKVLVQTLSHVMASQDFKTRIPHGATVDEFEKINFSINNLLSYTDTLIEEKEFLANTDNLTGILNRRSFTEGVQKELDRKKRYGGSLGLAVCDIDHFKAVNDTFGHNVGDQVLKYFASLLQAQLRQSDLLGRWGGEEFVILVPQAKEDNLRALGEKLRACIEEADFPGVGSISCSIGLAEVRSTETFEDIFRRADDALYKAKNNGRNRIEVAS
ncbi:MAG: diguanylate cyclase [Magnetovibrio sp.]|nr:diguanylate cyclase [Magnetovibrio sp.]